MSKAQELGLIVAQARQDILNRETVRQCKAIYAAIMEKAEEGARLGAYIIKGTVELDPHERYAEITIVNQMGLKLQMDGFSNINVAVSVRRDPANILQVSDISFSLTIPEMELPNPLSVDLEF